MPQRIPKICILILAPTLFSAAASAGLLTVGLMSYDVTAPGSTAQFDILNASGPNSTSFPDPTFPVTTALNMSSLALTVHYSDGSTQAFGSSYFSLNLDGLSWDGSTIPIGGANPQPVSATLTGLFSPLSVTLNDGSSTLILAGFSASLTPSSPANLQDGDFAIINATTTSAGGSVPEPESWFLMAVGLACILFARTKGSRVGMLQRSMARHWCVVPGAVLALGAIVLPSAHAQVKLNVATSPGSGVAGVDFVNVTGSGFPTGHGTIPAPNMTVSFSLTCGGTVAASTKPSTVSQIIGSSYRAHALLPAALATNLYYVSVSGTTSDSTAYSSTTCSVVQVTHTNATLSACVPTSSLGIVAPVTGPAPVRAIVPNGAWSSGTTGIQIVQLETGGGPVIAPTSITTTVAVNSCAGNPATNESVCVANDNHVYHLNSSNAVTTLTSSANQSTGFSGGSCENCGVAVNALTNQAVIAIGHAGSPSGSALQTLNLGSNAFASPVNLFNHVSEDISIDPTRGYILSPNESDIYDMLQMNSTTGAITGEFGRITGTGENDSAAEDCSTGIALTVTEFTNEVYLADLTQATFTPGTPGSWTGPQSITTIIGSYSAGLSGVTVAPGSAHLATVTGEFGGSSFSVLQLPATSGSGTPAIVDYAYVPCITGFSAGLDPHTVSAYTSPNDGKAYTVFASSPPPSELIVADMAGILARPRGADGHTVIGDSGQGGCLATGDGVIRSVATH